MSEERPEDALTLSALVARRQRPQRETPPPGRTRDVALTLPRRRVLAKIFDVVLVLLISGIAAERALNVYWWPAHPEIDDGLPGFGQFFVYYFQAMPLMTLLFLVLPLHSHPIQSH